MRPAISLVLLPLLLGSFLPVAHAEPPAPIVEVPVIPAIPDGKDQHVYVAKGQPAPYEGFLFDSPTATRWGNWLVLWKERYRIDMTQSQQICTAKVQLGDDRLRIEQQRNETVLANYKQQLEYARQQVELAGKKNDRPWYQSFEFGYGVGLATSVALVAVSAYAIKKAN